MTAADLSLLSIDRAPIRSPRGGGRRRIWITTVVGAIAVAAAASTHFGGAIVVDTAAVTTAYPSQAMTTLTATGYVVAQRQAAVASKATGRLEWLGVVEGSTVKRGDIIARLEDGDVEASREQAAAAHKVAQANRAQGQVELLDAERNSTRSQELVARKFISEAANDTAVARYRKAQASIKSLEASVDVAAANVKSAQLAVAQTTIRAPFDGVVVAKHANVGDNITPFSNAVDTKGAVVTIADMSTLEVEADVSEALLGDARIGQPVEIQLDAIADHRFPGVINRIVPRVDRAKATVLVKIKFLERDERVLPDMSAKVAFLSRAPSAADRRPLTVVPTAAVVDRDGAKFVYVVTDGHALKTAVETGRAVGELLEVHGINVGKKVVLAPSRRVVDGVALAVDSK